MSGGNAYLQPGTFAMSVSVMDRGGKGATTATNAGVAAATIVAQGAVVAATEANQVTEVVAKFTHGNLFALPSQFSATIAWGDGTSSAGTIEYDPVEGFVVLGTKTFANVGTYAKSVQVSESGGGKATVAGSAVVADAPIAATGFGFQAFEGVAFTGAVASILDPDPSSAASEFSATITWGDGGNAAGAISQVAGSPGR